MKRRYKYRFKTEEEFIKEFGESWRRIVQCSFTREMNYLLGTDLNEEYYYLADHFFNKNRESGYFEIYDGRGNWNITIGMLKRIDLMPIYKPKNFVY